ncbi:HDIG domain-containing protein [Thermosyntropha lipolytica DSM 11003]|uniref:HDIG domain-containing protein n=1 Tax=Thermosyntropha lipolytica DSM 11003 TaxID=1123382 RepID=A0A1M5Q3D5_9FIRM|nr:HD domain-containing protein [Thermosyntropha lipolytica]SHH08239.1 HDIG domain-containing protein [Thermosyntropha lipolytica DSM 11003]
MKKEEVFRLLEQHLLKDDRPAVFIDKLDREGILKRVEPFNLLVQLKKVEQDEKHHPEGNVWNHTLLVVDEAAKRRSLSREPRAFMWGALLHDLGKLRTTAVRKGRITAYDHDKIGGIMAEEFLSHFELEEKLVLRIVSLVKWHMQVLFVVKGLPFAAVEDMLQEIEAEEVALLALCDRLGRGGLTEEIKEKEEKDVKKFLQVCRGVERERMT